MPYDFWIDTKSKVTDRAV